MITAERLMRNFRDNKPFSLLKLNHGFWENCLNSWRLEDLHTSWSDEQIDKHLGRIAFKHGGFRDEVLQILRNWPSNWSNIQLDCTANAFPESQRLAPSPRTPADVIDQLIRDTLPDGWKGGDGLLWKNMAIDGSLSEVFRWAANKRVVLIGPRHLSVHLQAWGWQDYKFIEIPLRTARQRRKVLLTDVAAALEPPVPTVVIVQAGSLSVWLARHLLDSFPFLWILDMGRALDILSPEIVLNQPWGAAYSGELAQNYADCSEAWRKWSSQKVRTRTVIARDISVSTREPVSFVEHKLLDFSMLPRQLSASTESGHWANRGPAVNALEQLIASDLALPIDRKVVATSSGTAALWVATGLAMFRKGREIRWVGSRFSFFSARLGPLAKSVLIDCDVNGMLSLDSLKELPADSYDGIVLTDVFGRGKIEEIVEFAKDNDKSLIMDAAAAYDRQFHAQSNILTAISFHHTKPWGFGEGGCVLVDEQDVKAARALCNFSVGLPEWLAPCSGNWKMADLTAASIIQRIMGRDWWGPRYRLQFLRLKQLAEAEGIAVLPSANKVFPGNAVATPAHLACLMDSPISQEQLDICKLPFVARKYFRPLEDSGRASELYKRVVCIPVHCGMAALDNDQLSKALRGLKMHNENTT
jgi:dTDP-4-amino-4,6-dideoxygalactose transaminase